MKRLLLLLTVANINAMDTLGKCSVVSNVHNVQLVHQDKKFVVVHKGTEQEVQNAWIDKEVRGMESDALARFLSKGNYLSLKQSGYGDFSIQVYNRVRAGGPASGAAIYWLTKSLGSAVINGIIKKNPDKKKDKPEMHAKLELVANGFKDSLNAIDKLP